MSGCLALSKNYRHRNSPKTIIGINAVLPALVTLALPLIQSTLAKLTRPALNAEGSVIGLPPDVCSLSHL